MKGFRFCLLLLAGFNLFFVLKELISPNPLYSQGVELLRLTLAILIALFCLLWARAIKRNYISAWLFMTVFLWSIAFGFISNLLHLFEKEYKTSVIIFAVISQLVCAFGIFMLWKNWWVPKKVIYDSRSR
jgi:hypothetical protein